MDFEKERIAGLLKELKNGNKEVFEEFYKLTSPRAYFIALKIVRNEHDAEDILQESYIKLLESIKDIDPDRNFMAWFYKIVANKSKDFLKKQKLLVFEGEDEEIIDAIPDENPQFCPEENLNQDELCSEVMAAIDELTAEKRACIMMRYFGEMSVNEIAESLEVPVSTVKNRLFTARKDLKNKLEKRDSTVLYSAAPIGVVAWALGKSSQAVSASFAASAASAEVLAGVGAAGGITVAASSATAAAAATATATTATTATAAAATTAAASTAASTAATGAGVAAKVAALSVAQKVVIGAVAAGVVGGSTAGVATVVKENTPPPTTTEYIVEEVTTAPSQTDDFIFAFYETEPETEESVTETTKREPTATHRREKTTEEKTEPPTAEEKTTVKKTQAATTRRSRSKTTLGSTTRKNTTTETSTAPTTTETTTEETTTRATTTRKVTTTKAPTTAKSTTTKPATTQLTTARPTTTTEPATQSPATLIIEVTDFDNSVVETITVNVDAGTEITRDYLVALVSSNGYEAMAGVYGDAIGSVAESGQTYNFTAEL